MCESLYFCYAIHALLHFALYHTLHFDIIGWQVNISVFIGCNSNTTFDEIHNVVIHFKGREIRVTVSVGRNFTSALNKRKYIRLFIHVVLRFVMNIVIKFQEDFPNKIILILTNNSLRLFQFVITCDLLLQAASHGIQSRYKQVISPS